MIKSRPFAGFRFSVGVFSLSIFAKVVPYPKSEHAKHAESVQNTGLIDSTEGAEGAENKETAE